MYLRSSWHHKGVLGASLNCSIYYTFLCELPRIPIPRSWVNKGEGYLAAVRRPDAIFPILDDQLSICVVGSYREDEDARPLGRGVLVEDYSVTQGDHSGEYSLPL